MSSLEFWTLVNLIIAPHLSSQFASMACTVAGALGALIVFYKNFIGQ
jgi:hypothetical protein